MASEARSPNPFFWPIAISSYSDGEGGSRSRIYGITQITKMYNAEDVLGRFLGDLERSWGEADPGSQTIFFLWPQFVDDGEKANVMVMMITPCSPSCTGG